MTEPTKALISLPPAAVAAASAFAERTLKSRALVGGSENDLALPRVLIVDKVDPVCFPSIGSAVAAANDGDRVLVRAGRYEESVRIERALSVEGDGDSVTVVGVSSPAFTVAANGARIANMAVTRRGRSSAVEATDEPLGWPAALVVRADAIVDGLRLRDCPGLVVDGGRPTIRGCDFDGVTGDGILVVGSTAVIETCQFRAGHGAVTAIQIEDWPLMGSQQPRPPVQVRGNAIQKGQDASGWQSRYVTGIAVGLGGSAALEDNQVLGSQEVGILVSGASHAAIIRNHVGGSGYASVVVRRGSSASLEANTLDTPCVTEGDPRTVR